MRKLWTLLAVAILLLGGCSKPESIVTGVTTQSVPEAPSSGSSGIERPLLEGYRSGTQMEMESFIYFASPEPRITSCYSMRSSMPKANFLLTDNGVGVNLNGYRLQEAVISNDGSFVLLTVVSGKQDESIWRLTAQGELSCVAANSEKVFLDSGSAAVAYIEDGALYYLPPSLDLPLGLGPVKMQPEALYWVDRPNAVFSPDGEWLLYENGLVLCSVSAADDVRDHGKLNDNYLLGGISDDGNVLVYAEELYDDTKEAFEQEHGCQLYIVNVLRSELSTNFAMGNGCYAIFNKDGSELFVGGGTQFYLYELAGGLKRTNAPFGYAKDYQGYVGDFMVNDQYVVNHTGGWPPPGLVCVYAQAEHFTSYYFSEWSEEARVTFYQPLNSARPVWSVDGKGVVAVSPDGNQALLIDVQDNYWLAEVDGEGEVQLSRVENGEPPWLTPADSIFVWDGEKEQLWLEQGEGKILLWNGEE